MKINVSYRGLLSTLQVVATVQDTREPRDPEEDQGANRVAQKDRKETRRV